MIKTILIADDEYGFRYPIVIYLKMNGFNVIEASKEIEILDKIYEADLLLMDVIFPDNREGIKIVQNIRKNEVDKIRNIPVIFFSILSMDMCVDEIKDIKNYSWLQKPFELDKILIEIKKYMR